MNLGGRELELAHGIFVLDSHKLFLQEKPWDRSLPLSLLLCTFDSLKLNFLILKLQTASLTVSISVIFVYIRVF